MFQDYLNGNDTIYGSPDLPKRCHELQASCAFFWFLFATYCATLVLNMLDSRSSSGMSSRSSNRKGGPAMSQVQDANGEQCFALRDCCIPVLVCASEVRHMLTECFPSIRILRLMQASTIRGWCRSRTCQGQKQLRGEGEIHNNCLFTASSPFGYLVDRLGFKADGLAFFCVSLHLVLSRILAFGLKLLGTRTT